MDEKLIADATGRNALYKIHVSLGKIVNSLNEKGGRKSIAPESRASLAPESVIDDEDTEEKTIITHDTRGADDEDEDELTVMNEEKTVLTLRTRNSGDSILEEILSDDEL